MSIKSRSTAIIGALIALLCAAAPAGAHNTSHDASNGQLSERELFKFETRVLGSEHAREHAALRRLERLGVETTKPSQPALASSGTVFSSSIAAERSLGQSAGEFAAASVESTAGRWQPPFKIPVMAINAALLPTGKVLWYSYPANPNLIAAGPDAPNTAQAWLWDPVTGHTKRVDPPLWRDPRDGQMKPANIWCSGTSFLVDGRVVVAGGNLEYRRPGVAGKEFKGLDTVFTFNPFSETWTRQPDMEKGRWYPTQARLPDGDTVILSGLDETGDTVGYPTNKQIEVFNATPETDLDGVGTIAKLGERGLSGSPGTPPDGGLYPHAFWMPSGRLLIAGPDVNDSWFLNSADTSQPLNGQWEQPPSQPLRYRLFGSAVLLPNALGAGASTKVMQIGGWDETQTPHRTATTETFDETSATWGADQAAKALKTQRAHQNTVLLPDGSMVTVGGGVGKDEDDGDLPGDLQQWGAVPDQKKVELWNPTTGTWSYGAAQQEYRTYHSTAVLLPDGRVVSAGDDFNGGFNQDTAEIYEPPYLFKGPRPVISSGPQVGILGKSLQVATPNPALVHHAALVAPGATTHANDMNQRYFALTTTPGAGKVTMNLPSNQNWVPPGWYMLFLLSPQGVPSIAHFIRIGDAGTAQPGQIVVEQRSAPADGNGFSFNGAPFVDFDLSNGATKATTVLAGNYSVTQAAESGYDLTSISCDDGALSPSATDLGTRRATVHVTAGETVRCAFTNVKRASLTVEQRVRPASAGALRFGGSLGAFNLANARTRSFDLAPGTYSVTQAARSGFAVKAVGCNDSDSSVSRRSLTARLSPGEQLTCSFSARDSRAPVVRFSGLNRRKKTLTGRATDLAGVAKLSAALSQKAGRKCRWWSPRQHGFARRATACSKPAFIRASLRRTSTGRSWSVALKGLPSAGRYRVVTSAKDALGNTGRPSFSLRVRRR